MRACRRRWRSASRNSWRAGPAPWTPCRSSSSLRDIGKQIKDPRAGKPGFLPRDLSPTTSRGRGGRCIGARPADDARAAVLAICQRVGARTVTKGKSMISEELGVNDHLERFGITPVETDLGEYIIQLRREHPSHIIAPAFHLNREDWEDSFRQCHTDLDPARRVPRAARYPDRGADQSCGSGSCRPMSGSPGRTFLIAETGSSVIVTNEGNGDLTQDAAAGAHRPRPRSRNACRRWRTRPACFACWRGRQPGRTSRSTRRSRPGMRRPGRPGRARGVPRCAARWRAVGHAGIRVRGDAALHPLRRVHEPLPGLRRRGRALPMAGSIRGRWAAC